MENFDKELGMAILPPAEPNLDSLRFLRWLGENGKLEHPVYEREEDLVGSIRD